MPRFYFWAFTVALAGFLFGFDMVVTSGVDETLQALWSSEDLFHGTVVMGGALWGTVVGAMVGGWPANALGRKRTLVGIGVLYVVSAIGAALAGGPWVFATFRFLGGLGIGASTIAAPAYLTEIAPARSRGGIVAMYQLSIVLGIMAAFLSNYFMSGLDGEVWRWMMGVCAIPSVLYMALILLVPESPRWLVLQGRMEAAAEVLRRIDPKMDVAAFAAGMQAATAGRKENLFSPTHSRATLLVIVIAAFNQLSGINAFLFYSQRIFSSAGLTDSTAFLSSFGVGVVNVIFTLVGMALIDRLGRRQLMYIGSVGYIASLGLVTAAFALGWQGIMVPIFFFLFIASHAVGQGTVIWVFIAELFPTQVRASGQALGSSVHWVLAAAIPSLLPVCSEAFGPEAVFGFFAVMMVGQLLWVMRAMPETKGVSLEEMGDELSA